MYFLSMKQLWVIATENPGKIKEFANLMGTALYEYKSLTDIGFNESTKETGSTFNENAEIKAKAVHLFLKEKGMTATVLADDSGLEVEALNGAPGIYTGRYAGDCASDKENYELLLQRLKGEPNRRARFVCVLCVQKMDGAPLFFEGECHGLITEEPIGNEGFGYDPVFLPNGHSRTFAQMNLAEKKALSHRGEAIQKMLAYL